MRYCYLILASTVLLACSTTNPNYCDGPDDCQGDDYCDIGGVITETGLTNTCVPRPAGNPCNEVERGDCTAGEVCLIAAAGAGANECVDCEFDADCGGGGRTCTADNTCTAASCEQTSAGNDACQDIDDETPFCGMSDVCVECRDDNDCDENSDTPVCENPSGVCRACERNSECVSGACNLDDGACVNPEKIVYVDDDGGVDDPECGDPSDPCKTIPAALDEVAGDRETVVIRSGEYTELVPIVDKTVTLIGQGAVNIRPDLNSGQAAVDVKGTSEVRFENIDIALVIGGTETSVALRCDLGDKTASVSYADGTISGSDGIGVFMRQCDLDLSRSTIMSNARGGVTINNSNFTIVNNFIAYNGDSSNPRAAVVISSSGSSTQVLDFNTIVGNQVSDGARPSGVDCNTTPEMTATGNIVYFGIGGFSLQGPCLWAYSNLEGVDVAGTNISMTPLLVNNSAVNGDYHLEVDSPCINAVAPAAASIATDFDGQNRPSPDNAQLDCGADEYYPPSP